jgi:hypothetical protein
VVGRRSAAARLFVPLSLAAVGSLWVACSSPTGPNGSGHRRRLALTAANCTLVGITQIRHRGYVSVFREPRWTTSQGVVGVLADATAVDTGGTDATEVDGALADVTAVVAGGGDA